jgi:hypothetical protein
MKGLTILPSHRMVKRVDGFEAASFFRKAEKYFDIKPFDVSSDKMADEYENFKNLLAVTGEKRTAFAFFYHGSDKEFLLSLKEGAHGEMGEDLHDSLKQLDVVVCRDWFFRNVWGLPRKAG